MSAEWFGPRLKELREGRGWTQQQLADRAGLAVGIVRKLERRENKPTWETALTLASALGVSTEAFVQEPAERPPAGPGRPPTRMDEAEGREPESPLGRTRKTPPVKPRPQPAGQPRPR